MTNILKRIRLGEKGIFVALLIVATAIPVLLLVSPRYRIAEQRLFDRYQTLLPEPRTDERVRIVGIDDRAIAAVGQWPWSRDLLADGLLDIAEFNAERILLDIELSEPSGILVRRADLRNLRREYPGDVPAQELDRLFRDRDTYLASTLAAIDLVYLPTVIDDRDGTMERAPLPLFRNAARGTGFSNLMIDRDGVSRRIDPVWVLDSGEVRYQLGLALLDAVPEQNASGDRLRLRMPDGSRIDIPLDPSGRLLVRWPRARFEEAYPAMSWASLLEYRTAMEDLAFNLGLMDQAGYISERHRGTIQTLTLADTVREEMLTTGDEALLEEYRQLRQAFIALAGTFLNGNAEALILEELDSVIAGGDLSPAIVDQLETVKTDVSTVFQASRDIHAEILRLRRYLEEFLDSTIVLVGYTATSTTDLGVTPYDESFPNVGLHAAVITMVGDGIFVDQIRPVVSLLFGILWALVVATVIRYAADAVALVLGGVGVVVPIITTALVFIGTRIYLPVLSLTLPVLLLSIVALGFRYISSIRERRFIRSTFEHYLAPDIIRELIQDPSLLGVGGREESLTALFTDVRGFSRLAEMMGAAELVDLLNAYLTDMSEVILDQQGTIDKYEGDAIMAFFGAPKRTDDHAIRACNSAIRMKKLETVLNDRLLKTGQAPAALISRIGINTGPMIVGNLGTVHRMNYTVMGKEVNLASRLEGVNKQYGTWICISEQTERQISDGFLVRRMDRVRVKGMDRAIRLFELLGYQTESTAPQREALELFDAGLIDFEARNWETAKQRFETVLRIYPDDGPAKLFLERCRRFSTTPPRDSWDGVMSLTEK